MGNKGTVSQQNGRVAGTNKAKWGKAGKAGWGLSICWGGVGGAVGQEEYGR